MAPSVAQAAYREEVAANAQAMAQREPVAPKRGAPVGNVNNKPASKAGDKVKVRDAESDSPPAKPVRVTDAERKVRRLKRDAPEIAADLAAGKYPSVAAAARAAGIVKPVDPVAAIVRAAGKLSPQQLEQLRIALRPVFGGAL